MNWNDAWHDECRKTHRAGVEKRTAQPYEGGTIPFLLRPYTSPDNPVTELILEGGLGSMERENMYLVRHIFKECAMPAALVQADSMAVSGQKFCEYFGLQFVEQTGKYLKEYTRILNEQFGGSMANLPRSLWRDVILTHIKGPCLLPLGIMTFYEKGKNGEVVLCETRENSAGEFNVLPDWWEQKVH
jgi:hypothetical protein